MTPPWCFGSRFLRDRSRALLLSAGDGRSGDHGSLALLDLVAAPSRQASAAAPAARPIPNAIVTSKPIHADKTTAMPDGRRSKPSGGGVVKKPGGGVGSTTPGGGVGPKLNEKERLPPPLIALASGHSAFTSWSRRDTAGVKGTMSSNATPAMGPNTTPASVAWAPDPSARPVATPTAAASRRNTIAAAISKRRLASGPMWHRSAGRSRRIERLAASVVAMAMTPPITAIRADAALMAMSAGSSCGPYG